MGATIMVAEDDTSIQQFRNYTPPHVSEISKYCGTNPFDYVIVNSTSYRSEGIYYELSKSHSGRYCETM